MWHSDQDLDQDPQYWYIECMSLNSALSTLVKVIFLGVEFHLNYVILVSLCIYLQHVSDELNVSLIHAF
jgi:hypothetical protein